MSSYVSAIASPAGLLPKKVQKGSVFNWLMSYQICLSLSTKRKVFGKKLFLLARYARSASLVLRGKLLSANRSRGISKPRLSLKKERPNHDLSSPEALKQFIQTSNMKNTVEVLGLPNMAHQAMKPSVLLGQPTTINYRVVSPSKRAFLLD